MLGSGAALVRATPLATGTADGTAAGRRQPLWTAPPPAGQGSHDRRPRPRARRSSPRPTKPPTFSSGTPATSRVLQPAHLDTPTASGRVHRGHRKMFASGAPIAAPPVEGSSGRSTVPCRASIVMTAPSSRRTGPNPSLTMVPMRPGTTLRPSARSTRGLRAEGRLERVECRHALARTRLRHRE